MTLTNTNYFSPEAMGKYWSVSQFKEFDRCEAAGLASARGQITREETDALLMGKYVDAYFSGEMDEFVGRYADIMYTKKGTLYAKYERCERMINAIECQPLLMDFLDGQKQVIMTGDLFGVEWKCKLDVLHDDKIVDLKTVKDFQNVYKDGFGYVSPIEYWGWDVQGAVYQAIVEQNTEKKLPFYICAVTKEPIPDVDLIQIPQHVLDTALKVVESKIDRFDLVKSGEIPPSRCEVCDYCKSSKILTEPKVYEGIEA